MEPLKKPIQPYYLPQMHGIPYSFISDNLKEMEIEHKPIMVSISQLKPLQKEVDINKIKSMSSAEDKEDFDPVYISRKGHILDGHHRTALKKYEEGDNGRIRCIRIDADEKDGAAILKVIQDRWERQQKPTQ